VLLAGDGPAGKQGRNVSFDVREFQLGHRPDLDNDAYHAAPGLSKSKLDAIAPPSTPLHYWAKHVDPNREPEKKTEALILGDAIHKAVLEPDLVAQHFVEVPADAPKKPSIAQINAKNPSAESRGSIDYWAGFNAEHKGKIILKAEEMKMVLRVRDTVHRHPVAGGLFAGGRAEQSYFAIDPDTGLLVKCRLDYDLLEQEGTVVDLKTTISAAPRAFGYSATDYRYDGQRVWYDDVLFNAFGERVVEQFVFVAVEKEWPHAIGVYYHDPAPTEMAEVRAELRRDALLIQKCHETGYWPDYAEEPQRLRIARRRD
jgi:hypothetical protein